MVYLGRPYSLKNFQRLSSTNFTWFILKYFDLYMCAVIFEFPVSHVQCFTQYYFICVNLPSNILSIHKDYEIGYKMLLDCFICTPWVTVTFQKCFIYMAILFLFFCVCNFCIIINVKRTLKFGSNRVKNLAITV